MAGKQVDVVLTAIARDRPELVERLAEIVDAHSGNWVDSSMARLGGEFAGIVRVEVPQDDADALKQSLVALGADGIDVTVRADAGAENRGGSHARLSFTGLDHPGIVLEVTRMLARHGASIDQLETNVSRGSMGAEPMFQARADVVLPAALDLQDLRVALEAIAQDIMVDIELSEVGRG